MEMVKLPACQYFQSVSGSFLNQHKMNCDSWLNLDLQELFSDSKVIECDQDILEFGKHGLPKHLVKWVFNNIVGMINFSKGCLT